MQACTVMISTKADGTASEIVREGRVELLPRSAKIVYFEENATVSVSLCGEKATIVREGDYQLSLFLENGKKTKGEIGIAGNSGEIWTQTHSIESKITEDYVVACLQYDLLVSGESQKMELRLLVKRK